ncbi:MAG: nitrogenase [Oscillochloris sp.]|nr:nitrogenase [Oscillochloris sp.]
MSDLIDLTAKTCPNREQRANGVNIFFGKASQLVQDAREGKLCNCERKFQQTSGCVLNFYLTVRVATIRDAAVVFHAPVGCSASALGYREFFRRIPPVLGRPAEFDLHWLTTNLQERDVVHGAAAKLEYAIREAERRYAPKAIFILTSCTTGIIGEDIEGVVNDLQPEIRATIVPVHCEGVRSRLVQTGYDAFWHGVLKYLVKPPQRKQPDLVNVASMLSYTWQDRLEITRLLGKLGLRPNFIPEFATVAELEQMSEAAVTAPLCPTYTDYLSRGLEQEYGVPYFLDPSPTGITNTDEWLRQIGKYTGKEDEVEALIAEEHAVWVPKLEAIRQEFLKLKGDGSKLTVLGALGQGRLLGQTPYFHELGLAPTAAITQDFDNLVLEETEKLIRDHGDFDILVNTFQAAEKAVLATVTDPDLMLTCPFQGTSYKRTEGIARVHALRGDPSAASAQSGYTGAVACGHFLLKTLQNKSFQRTMMVKTGDTYKPWWYEQTDPLYYAEKETI